MKQMVDTVYAGLAPLFPGFKLDKSEEGFVRKIREGTQKLLVPFVDLDPRYEFSLLCCVRLDAVEDICNLFNTAPPRYHSMTVTSTTPLEYFGQDEYIFTSMQGLKEAVASLALVSSDILRFMDRYQDVQALHQAMDSEGSSFDNSADPDRTMRELTLARLCSETDFRRIVAHRKAVAEKWPEDDRKRLMALIAHLEHMKSPNDTNLPKSGAWG